MTDLVTKIKEFADIAALDVETVFAEFVAFVEGKKVAVAANDAGEAVVQPIVTEVAPVLTEVAPAPAA